MKICIDIYKWETERCIWKNEQIIKENYRDRISASLILKTGKDAICFIYQVSKHRQLPG